MRHLASPRNGPAIRMMRSVADLADDAPAWIVRFYFLQAVWAHLNNISSEMDSSAQPLNLALICFDFSLKLHATIRRWRSRTMLRATRYCLPTGGCRARRRLSAGTVRSGRSTLRLESL